MSNSQSEPGSKSLITKVQRTGIMQLWIRSDRLTSIPRVYRPTASSGAQCTDFGTFRTSWGSRKRFGSRPCGPVVVFFFQTQDSICPLKDYQTDSDFPNSILHGFFPVLNPGEDPRHPRSLSSRRGYTRNYDISLAWPGGRTTRLSSSSGKPWASLSTVEGWQTCHL